MLFNLMYSKIPGRNALLGSGWREPRSGLETPTSLRRKPVWGRGGLLGLELGDKGLVSHGTSENKLSHVWAQVADSEVLVSEVKGCLHTGMGHWGGFGGRGVGLG